jgi:hypothetical protein
VSRISTLKPIDQLRDDDILSVDQVAAWLGHNVTPAWVRAHANPQRGRGDRRFRIPSFKPGKYLFFTWGSLRKWRERLEQERA